MIVGMDKRLNTDAAEMYDMYSDGYSLEDVGNFYGKSRQSVYGLFKNRGWKLRTMKRLHRRNFNGNTYTLRNNGYYGKTSGNRSLMHRDVWEFHNGSIPDGYDIHHIDHDKTNNDISNLELYTKSEHAKKFATGHNQYTKKTNVQYSEDAYWEYSEKYGYIYRKGSWKHKFAKKQGLQ